MKNREAILVLTILLLTLFGCKPPENSDKEDVQATGTTGQTEPEKSFQHTRNDSIGAFVIGISETGK